MADTDPGSAGTIAVRTFRDGDEAAVAGLWREVFPDAPAHNHPETDIERKRAIQRDLFLVATEIIDGTETIVGTTMAGYDGHRGWVYYVAVLPSHRRRGIGAALMRKAEQRLRALGCPKINLQVRADNRAVVSFYAQLGFATQDLVSMGKRLVDTH